MCYYIKELFFALIRNPARSVRAMASLHRASGKSLPRFYKRRLFPARKNCHVLPALLLLLLFFAVGCAPFSSPQAGLTHGAAKGNAQITYVAIGASDTFGIGTDDPYTNNWPTDLLYMLGANHIHLINLGIPGITVHDALNLELPIVIDAHPDLVTIWLGVNDIANSVPVTGYAKDLNTLLGR